MNPVDFARSWTDALTALAIGATTFAVPSVTKFDPDGTTSIALGEISSLFVYSDETTGAAAVLVSILVAAFFLVIGYTMIQIGELISYLPNVVRRRSKIRQRVEFVSQHSAIGGIFANAYLAFRLYCGVGAMFMGWGIILMFLSTEHGLQSLIAGVVLLVLGLNVSLFLSRVPFAVVDWIIFNESDFIP